MIETVGYAWFFENTVIFGTGNDVFVLLQNRKASQYGQFLGVVKGIIPKDPYCILYEWLHHSKGFKHRRSERRILRKLGLSRRWMRKMKREGQQEL